MGPQKIVMFRYYYTTHTCIAAIECWCLWSAETGMEKILKVHETEILTPNNRGRLVCTPTYILALQYNNSVVACTNRPYPEAVDVSQNT